MGFFSSRRHDTDVFIEASGNNLPQRTSPSPGIIRSRFYGKNKGKARETNSTPPTESRKVLNSHESPTVTNGHRSLKDGRIKSSPESSSTPHQTSMKSPVSATSSATSTRASTDAVTIMLAQRLAELASANAEGLLNDDEYRLLRQNLFERLGNSTMPQEAPVVPTAGPSRPRPPETPRRTDLARSPSIQSKATISSSVSGLLRRATSRKNKSADTDTLRSETMSVLSTTSNSPNTFAHRLLRMTLSKQSSTTSLILDTSYPVQDNVSIPYPVTPSRSDGSGKPVTPSVSRSSTTRSKRRAPQPPSAFHNRTNGTDYKRIPGILDDDLDDEELKSSKEIRSQIEAVESEERKLMGAFDGLELSALTRRSQSNNVASLPSSTHFLHGVDSIESFHQSKDADGVSLRSVTSNGTSHRSPVRASRTVPTSPLVAQPISLARKSSISSISSRGRSGATNGAPYLPALPSSLGRLWAGSSSSVNLTRSVSHLPLAPVAEGDSRESIEGHVRHLRLDTSPSILLGGPSYASSRKNEVIGDDGVIIALEAEMAEIRRRRAEVMRRCEERLSYLRAKLKGAELHEKLLRR